MIPARSHVSRRLLPIVALLLVLCFVPTVSARPTPAAPDTPGVLPLDNTLSLDDLRHDSRDTLYRTQAARDRPTVK